jgi:rhamnopyranosyl-N-acetylglucosaminyl-diphospho-decaprenol beta-1,3/1,4-galactofuranosyltransferase
MSAEPEQSRPSIATVIITHDRLGDLKRCVDAVRAQTFPSEIIVVDNASSDGTREWLDAQSDVAAIHQGDEGPAGGAYTGIKHSYEKQFDACWLLDDDALPEANALERLVASPAFDGTNMLGSVVVRSDDPDTLAYPVPRMSSYSALFDYYRDLIERVPDLQAESDDRGYPWSMMNAHLIPSEIIAAVGLPKREFYMGGEETEYHYRIRSHGFGTYLVLDSICRHPKAHESAMATWRQRSLVRNTVYIHRRYRRWFVVRTIRRVVVYAATGRWELVSAIWDGLRNDFSRRYVDSAQQAR